MKKIVKILPNWKLRVLDIKAFASDETHFFDKDTMRFFASKIHAPGYKVEFEDGTQGVVFVTTEKSGFEDYYRKATLRIIPEYKGSVDKIGEFGEFQSVGDARFALRDMVKNLAK